MLVWLEIKVVILETEPFWQVDGLGEHFDERLVGSVRTRLMRAAKGMRWTWRCDSLGRVTERI